MPACVCAREGGDAVWRMHVLEGDLSGEGEQSGREETEERVGAADREKKKQEESKRGKRPATARLPLSVASWISVSTAAGLLPNCEWILSLSDCVRKRLGV